MPGGRRLEPSKPLPRLAVFILIVAFIDFAVDWLLTFTIDRWARQSPTANHWYQYRMGGRTYYLSPSIGWYLDNDLWIYLGAIAMFFVLSLVYGVRWKRVR